MSTTPVQKPAGSKPQSIKIEPWTDFARQSYSIHGDDFCDSKLFVAKFVAKGKKSTLNIKETLSKKDGKHNLQDQVKVWFDLPNNHSLYTKVKSTNYIKVHYDHGIHECKHLKKWNFYTSFWTDKALSKSSVRFGLANYNQKCDSDNRIRINTNSGAHTFHWYHRTMAKHNSFKFGIVTVVDLTNKVLEKNNVLLGYNYNSKHDGFLRLESEGFRKNNPDWINPKTLWDSLTANYVLKFDSTTKLGAQAKLNLADNSLAKFQFVIEKALPQNKTTLKAKVNTHQEVAILFKRPLWGFEDLATLSLGGAIHHILSEKRSFNHGVQLDINI